MRRWCVLLVMAVSLVGCGGTSRSPRTPLVVGRLPDGHGFRIWAQRYGSGHGRYVQLIAAIVPPGASSAEAVAGLSGGRYVVRRLNLDLLGSPDQFTELVGCTSQPVALLFGLSHGSGNEDSLGLHYVPLPKAFGDKGGEIAWRPIASTTTLEMRNLTGQIFFTHTYPGPPARSACRRG